MQNIQSALHFERTHHRELFTDFGTQTEMETTSIETQTNTKWSAGKYLCIL